MTNRFFLIAFPALFIIAVGLAVMTCVPKTREIIQNVVLANTRKILAMAEGRLSLTETTAFKVIKVKTQNSLAIEIFKSDDLRTKPQFLRRIVLDEAHKDAYITFRGVATNLALADVDGDDVLDIVAPAYSRDLVPRVNVYRFDPDIQDFQRLSPDKSRL